MEALSPVAINSIPLFIKEDAPGFVNFLSAYYDWLTLQKLEFKTVLDIDTTVDLFLENFVNQYLFVLPKDIVADKRLLIKHIKDFYGSKGTEESIKLLFKTLYGEEVSVKYPNDSTFKTSDDQWTVAKSIKVSCTDISILLKQDSLVVSGVASARIERVHRIAPAIYEIFLSNIVGEFVAGSPVNIDLLSGVVLPVVSSVSITSGGQYYKPTNLGASTGILDQPFKCVVKEVSSGPIETLFMLVPGSGYVVGDVISDANNQNSTFKALVSAIGTGGEILSATVINKVTHYSIRPILTVTSVNGVDASVIAQGPSIGSITAVDIISSGLNPVGVNNIAFERTEPHYNVDLNALITGNTGALTVYPGVATNIAGLTSSIASKLQDNFENKPFTYLIASAQSIKQYKAILKDILHPAGMSMFGELRIETLKYLSGVIFDLNNLDSRGGPLFRDVLKLIDSSAVYSDNVTGNIDLILLYIEDIIEAPVMARHYQIDMWKNEFYTRTIGTLAGFEIGWYSMEDPRVAPYTYPSWNFGTPIWLNGSLVPPFIPPSYPGKIAYYTEIMPDAEYYKLTPTSIVTGMSELIPTVGRCIEPYACSTTGSVIVGYGDFTGGNYHGFRWVSGVTTDLGTLGGNVSIANGCSADGSVVVGRSHITGSAATHAFRWTGGVMTDLGTLGGTNSYSTACSSDGSVVVGFSDTTGNVSMHAFRWVGGVMTDLGTLGGTNSLEVNCSADGAVVIGKSQVAGDAAYHTFRWTGGVMTDLGTLGGTNSTATDCSTDGAVVVGWSDNTANTATHAYRWTGAVMTDLGTLGGTNSIASACSADGAVVIGNSDIAGNTASHAYRWTGAVMTDLGTLGGTNSLATDCSSDGAVVIGDSDTLGNTSTHAFHWTGGIISDIGTLGGTNSSNRKCSADGSTVIGTSLNIDASDRAFRWATTNPSRMHILNRV